MPINPANPPNYVTNPAGAIPVYITGSQVTTVLGLPTPGTVGQFLFVNDSSVALSSASVGATVVGGGTDVVPVYFDGTNWIIF